MLSALWWSRRLVWRVVAVMLVLVVVLAFAPYPGRESADGDGAGDEEGQPVAQDGVLAARGSGWGWGVERAAASTTVVGHGGCVPRVTSDCQCYARDIAGSRVVAVVVMVRWQCTAVYSGVCCRVAGESSSWPRKLACPRLLGVAGIEAVACLRPPCESCRRRVTKYQVAAYQKH